jgi:hypothetical protein
MDSDVEIMWLTDFPYWFVRTPSVGTKINTLRSDISILGVVLQRMLSKSQYFDCLSSRPQFRIEGISRLRFAGLRRAVSTVETAPNHNWFSHFRVLVRIFAIYIPLARVGRGTNSEGLPTPRCRLALRRPNKPTLLGRQEIESTPRHPESPDDHITNTPEAFMECISTHLRKELRC